MPATAAAVNAPLPAPVSRSDDAGVVTLTLSRPAQRNSLSEAMMAALTAALG